MQPRFLAILLCAFAVSASAETRVFKIDSANTNLQFEVRHYLGKVVGRFHDVHGTLRIDSDHPEDATLEASCATRTIDTANQTRDNHLRGELFAVEKFPQAIFRSRKIVRTGSKSADVTGDLTLHGVTHALVLHVTLAEQTNKGSRWHVQSDAISRRAFGLVFSSGTEAVSGIGDQVTLKIDCDTTD